MPHGAPVSKPNAVTVAGHRYPASTVVARLAPYITERRKARIDAVLAARTYSVAPVLEGLYDRGNVSAVLRSAEAFGLQRVHVIKRGRRFKEANRVTQGAEKWLDIARWADSRSCIEHVRAQGYRILATGFREAVPIDSVDFSLPTAVIFGNEHDGVSEEAVALADQRVVMPMLGFSQSFNISVAAALCFQSVYRDRIARLGHHGDLTANQRLVLRAQFYLKTVRSAPAILEREGPEANSSRPACD